MIEASQLMVEVALENGGPAIEQFDVAMAAIAFGLSALGAGYAERGIGAAAVGAMAEDEDLFTKGLILTVLPETLVIFALIVLVLVLFI